MMVATAQDTTAKLLTPPSLPPPSRSRRGARLPAICSTASLTPSARSPVIKLRRSSRETGCTIYGKSVSMTPVRGLRAWSFTVCSFFVACPCTQVLDVVYKLMQEEGLCLDT